MKLATLTAIALTLLPLPSFAQDAPLVVPTYEVRIAPEPPVVIPASLRLYSHLLEGRSQAEVNYLAQRIELHPLSITPEIIEASIANGNAACRRAERGEDLIYIDDQRRLGASESRVEMLWATRDAGLAHLCPDL